MFRKLLPILCLTLLASCSNKNAEQNEVKPAEQPAAEAQEAAKPAAEAQEAAKPAAEAQEAAKPAAEAQEAAPKADENKGEEKADEAEATAAKPIVKITDNGPEVAIQPSREPDKVVVKLGEAQTLIDSEADFGAAEDPLTVIQVMDINFDGSKDILVPRTAGMQNITYDVWVWNTDRNGFIKVGDLQSASIPELNAEKKEIRVSVHVSAAESTSSVLQFNGDKMDVIRTLEIGPVEGKDNTFARKVTVIKDGQKNVTTVEFGPDNEELWNQDF